MPTVTRSAARDQVAPALQKAQDTLTDAVLPALRDALVSAKGKSVELLDSDAALEAKRRSVAVVRAARGDAIVAPAASRRWKFGIGMIAIGTGIGFGFAWLSKRLATPIESYQTGPLPVPSGTDGGLTTSGFGTGASASFGDTTTTSANGSSDGAAPSGTAIEDIDLTSGARTTTT